MPVRFEAPKQRAVSTSTAENCRKMISPPIRMICGLRQRREQNQDFCGWAGRLLSPHKTSRFVLTSMQAVLGRQASLPVPG
jgi:hypothetical protein